MQYGYIESRINFPYQSVFWPAFCTFKGEGVSSPTNAAEIDIAEMISSLPNNIVTTNIHHDYCGPHRSDYNPSTGSCTNFPKCNYVESSPVGYNWNGSWHTYAVEWSPSKIIFYVDNSPIRIYNQTGQTDPETGMPIYPVDPVRLILGIGMDKNSPISSTSFPQKVYVDYVKVYELDNDCNTNLNACNYNFSAHDNKVKKNIIIGNGGCSNSLSSGDNVYMRASEGVLINGDFTVPVRSQLYLDVNSCY